MFGTFCSRHWSNVRSLWLWRRDFVRFTGVGLATDRQNSLAGGLDKAGVMCRHRVVGRQSSMRPQSKRFAVLEVSHLRKQFIAQAGRWRRREHRLWRSWPMHGAVSRALTNMAAVIGGGRCVD